MGELKSYSKNYGFNKSHKSYITNGNNALQLAPNKVEEPYKRERIRENTRPNKNINIKKQEKRNTLSLLIFVAATVIMLFLCIEYLKTELKINEIRNNNKTIERQITKLTTQNDSLDYDVNSYIDVDNIIKVATQKLGMVQVTNNQVSLYKSTESEYMKQFSNVPNAE